MTSAAARYGYILCLAVLMALAGCDSPADAVPVRVIDLLDEFDRAERRPPEGRELASHSIAGVAHPAIAMPVPSRITWDLPLPRRGTLQTSIALEGPDSGHPPSPVRFRIGVSDDRIYEGLAELIVTPEPRRWIDLRVDLSAYAGWKWSLFYRPDRITWRVVLATDAGGDAPSVALWGAPEIVTDTRSAKEYSARRRELHARRSSGG